MPNKKSVMKSVSDALKVFRKRQNSDGSIGLFGKYGSTPFLTTYAAHALALAKAKDVATSPLLIENVKKYLNTLVEDLSVVAQSQEKVTNGGYALYVLFLLGNAAERKKLQAKAEGFYTAYDINAFPTEVLGWLLSVLGSPLVPSSPQAKYVGEITRYLQDQARVSADGKMARFYTYYVDEDYRWDIYHTPVRTDAVILNALVEVKSNSPLVSQLVTHLLEMRRANGHWYNTQENAWASIALGGYFASTESVHPDCVVRGWVIPNDNNTEKIVFCGESMKLKSPKDTTIFNIPLRELTNVDQSKFVLQKDGKGRIYYNVELKCAPDTFTSGVTSENGFRIRRTYEAAHESSRVTRTEGNKWTFTVGSYIRVRVSFEAQQVSHHVAVVDNLAGGVESIDFEVTKHHKIQPDPKANEWCIHQNLRDDRAEAFARKLITGEYEYVYYTRAVVPGTFNVPPAKAELMYDPDVTGSSDIDIVTVV